MHKKKISIAFAILFAINAYNVPLSKQQELIETKAVLSRAINNNSLANITIQPKHELMAKYNNYKKIEKEYLDKVAQRDIEVANIIERNNRKENVQFDPYNLLVVSNITVDELITIFQIKEKPYMIELCNAFVDAENIYGVNAIFLAGLVAQESLWAEIPAGDGDNVTGMGVFNPGYKGYTYGGSKYRNIMATAEQIKNNYLTEDGEFYNGLSTSAVNTRYCLKAFSEEADYDWSYNINEIATDLNNIYHTEVKQLEDLPDEIPIPDELINKPLTEWEEQNIWKII